MKATEIREMTNEELAKKLEEFKSELFVLRFQNETGQLENPMKINLIKKDIARVKTVLRERAANVNG
ncbi:MAG: 50S ribosomal protein L29 [Clostridiales bacterium]|nr:50S ribosomal protein L29 [Clostridiales bacterium]